MSGSHHEWWSVASSAEEASVRVKSASAREKLYTGVSFSPPVLFQSNTSCPSPQDFPIKIDPSKK